MPTTPSIHATYMLGENEPITVSPLNRSAVLRIGRTPAEISIFAINPGSSVEDAFDEIANFAHAILNAVAAAAADLACTCTGATRAEPILNEDGEQATTVDGGRMWIIDRDEVAVTWPDGSYVTSAGNVTPEMVS